GVRAKRIGSWAATEPTSTTVRAEKNNIASAKRRVMEAGLNSGPEYGREPKVRFACSVARRGSHESARLRHPFGSLYRAPWAHAKGNPRSGSIVTPPRRYTRHP